MKEKGETKKYLLAVLVVVLLVLDWAALDDITTGNEPDYFLEYATLVVSVIVFLFIILNVFKRR